MIELTEARRPGACILSEAERSRSRDNVTLAASQTVLANGLLGKVGAVGAADAAVGATVGAGDGVLTLANPKTGAGVKAGVYKVIFVEPATNAGAFVVEDPDGIVVGNGTVGVAFTGVVKFTVADGGTDFAAGAYIPITVTVAAPADAGQYKAWDPDATDGSQVPAAVSIYAVTTGAGETRKIAVINTDAQLIDGNIAWPEGLAPDQKTAAIAALRDLGIKVR